MPTYVTHSAIKDKEYRKKKIENRKKKKRKEKDDLLQQYEVSDTTKSMHRKVF